MFPDLILVNAINRFISIALRVKWTYSIRKNRHLLSIDQHTVNIVCVLFTSHAVDNSNIWFVKTLGYYIVCNVYECEWVNVYKTKRKHNDFITGPKRKRSALSLVVRATAWFVHENIAYFIKIIWPKYIKVLVQ